MEFAQKLAPDHDLVLVARRRDRLEILAAQLREQHGAAVEVLAADLTAEPDLAMVARRLAASPNLALLVNNAGFGVRGLFWQAALEEQQRMHRLHIDAILRLSHAALSNMVPRNAGAIINVASVAGFVRRAGSASYGSTKSWLIAFTEGLYLELSSIRSAVKVQALCPGYTLSEFHDLLNVDRGKVASPGFWLTARQVVNESLRGLSRGKLFVIPGWRYKLIVAFLTTLPIPLRLAVERKASKASPAPPKAVKQ